MADLVTCEHEPKPHVLNADGRPCRNPRPCAPYETPSLYRWIEGRCPACGSYGTLFVAEGGHVTCSLVNCANPTAVADALERQTPDGSDELVRNAPVSSVELHDAVQRVLDERDNLLHALREIAAGRGGKNPQRYAEGFLRVARLEAPAEVGSGT